MSSRNRYFCYQCQQNVGLRDTDMACGLCGGEFIEQLESAPPPFAPAARRTAYATRRTANAGPYAYGRPPAQAASQQPAGGGGGNPELYNIQVDLMDMLRQLGGAIGAEQQEPGQQPGGGQEGGDGAQPQDGNAANPGAQPAAAGGNPPPPGQQGAAGGPRGGPGGQGENPLEGLLRNIFGQLGQAAGAGGAGQAHVVGNGPGGNGVRVQIQLGGGPPFNVGRGQRVVGNLGDYVFGNMDMDNIVSQLMNEMDARAQQARGISDEDLKKIPMIKVNQKHVDNQTQCSTCFEMFTLDEPVAELNCQHIFHKPCVEPWLKQHHTCPICRQDVDPSQWTALNTDDSQPQAAQDGLIDIDELD